AVLIELINLRSAEREGLRLLDAKGGERLARAIRQTAQIRKRVTERWCIGTALRRRRSRSRSRSGPLRRVVSVATQQEKKRKQQRRRELSNSHRTLDPCRYAEVPVEKLSGRLNHWRSSSRALKS